MLIKPQLGFTYDGPHCMRPVNAAADVFALRKGKAEFACDCSDSRLLASIRDNVLSVEYPCALCGKRHEAAFVPDRPLSGMLCALECPSSGLPTGYVSTPEQIEYISGAENDALLSDFILHYFGMNGEKPKETGHTVPGCLTCSCGSRHFSASIRGGLLQITCQKCGGITVLPEDSKERKPT